MKILELAVSCSEPTCFPKHEHRVFDRAFHLLTFSTCSSPWASRTSVARRSSSIFFIAWIWGTRRLAILAIKWRKTILTAKLVNQTPYNCFSYIWLLEHGYVYLVPVIASSSQCSLWYTSTRVSCPSGRDWNLTWRGIEANNHIWRRRFNTKDVAWSKTWKRLNRSWKWKVT